MEGRAPSGVFWLAKTKDGAGLNAFLEERLKRKTTNVEYFASTVAN
jgi:hypothetical protein